MFNLLRPTASYLQRYAGQQTLYALEPDLWTTRKGLAFPGTHSSAVAVSVSLMLLFLVLLLLMLLPRLMMS